MENQIIESEYSENSLNDEMDCVLETKLVIVCYLCSRPFKYTVGHKKRHDFSPFVTCAGYIQHPRDDLRERAPYISGIDTMTSVYELRITKNFLSKIVLLFIII